MQYVVVCGKIKSAAAVNMQLPDIQQSAVSETLKQTAQNLIQKDTVQFAAISLPNCPE